jgi:ligand-binding sensor domain-containing protein
MRLDIPPREPHARLVEAKREDAGNGARLGAWHSFGQADGLSGGSVQALQQSTDGAMWVGTQSGLSRYDGSSVTTYDVETGLPSSNVLALADDGESLWIGTDRGLCHLQGSVLRCYDGEHGLPAESVQALAVDGDGRLWVGTPLGLASREGDRFRPWVGEDGLPGHMVSDLQVQGDTLWVATWGGLAAWSDGGLTPSVGTGGGVVFDIDGDVDGSLWIGSSQGLVQRRPDGSPRTFGTADGLPSDEVLAVLSDSYGTTWVSTGTTIAFQAGAGMCRWTGDDFDCFGVEQGLASNQVLRIAEDREGLLWVGTTAGISRFGGGHFSQYGVDEGLPHPVVQDVLRAQDGALWVGTQAGLARVTAAGVESSAPRTACQASRCGRCSRIGAASCGPARTPVSPAPMAPAAGSSCARDRGRITSWRWRRTRKGACGSAPGPRAYSISTATPGTASGPPTASAASRSMPSSSTPRAACGSAAGRRACPSSRRASCARTRRATVCRATR